MVFPLRAKGSRQKETNAVWNPITRAFKKLPNIKPKHTQKKVKFDPYSYPTNFFF